MTMNFTNRNFSRRDFLKETVLTTAAGWSLSVSQALNAAETNAGGLHISPFRFDVTPPIGHSCCGGWIKPIEVVDDTLEAVGVVLLGAGQPIVLCAVDWTGLLNEAHVEWRTALAQAAGTTVDRVAVHCVHQHNAPFACLEAERIVLAEGDLPHIVDLEFFQRCLDAGRKSVEQAVKHLVGSAARVEVKIKRRIYPEMSGKFQLSRSDVSPAPSYALQASK